MENLGKMIFIVLTEGLFLALVTAVVWLLATRSKLREAQQESRRRAEEISGLRQRLELAHQHLQTANKRIAELKNTHPQLDDALLQNYQQRIANLEKFKDLYFELDERLYHDKNDSEQVEQLQKLVETQNQSIANLHAKLVLISKNYGTELNLTEELREQIQAIQESASELKSRLDHTKQQRDLVKMNAQDVERYKKRVHDLEVTETRLQQELATHSRRVEELGPNRSPAPAYGAVRVREVEDLNSRLKQRENEIRRLRQECETIGLQYEELAARSLAMAAERGDLSDDQRAQLEQLKRMLEENAAELARKQAECEMLENCYLALEHGGELEEAAERMQQSYVECKVLQVKRRDLNTQVATTASPEMVEEIAKLHQALADKEASLSKVRSEYKEIKEQFVQIAKEESELRETQEALRDECEKLRNEVNQLKENRQELVNQQEELEKLRAEYTKMESRYLALVKKAQ
ncbi:MAG TPA: hypothetical protein VFM32_02910 [Spongiibacteraceae bacterium]|nr:hypothetical protein [Spongiibacteraceae bacterium]